MHKHLPKGVLFCFNSAMYELDNNEKNTIPENLVQEPTDGKNDQSGKEGRGMDNERKKSSGLLWLLLVLLVAILTGIIFMITPPAK